MFSILSVYRGRFISKIYTDYAHSLFLSSLTEHGVEIDHMRKTSARNGPMT